MDGYEFIAALVSSLAWPAAIAVLALAFRSQLVSLLARVKSANVGPVSADFERELHRAEELVEIIQEEAVEGKPPEEKVSASNGSSEEPRPERVPDRFVITWTSHDEDVLQTMLRTDAKSAFLFCWARLRMAVAGLQISVRGEQPDRDLSQFIHGLAAFGLRDNALIELFSQIFIMKAKVTSYSGDFAVPPDSGDVERFRSIVKLALAELDRQMAQIAAVG